jgi:CRISPR-associated protein Cmr3
MTTFDVQLAPRDPVIVRDGRPFSFGLRMRPLDWLYPSVMAGALRTLLGHRQGGFPPRRAGEYGDLVKRLKSVAIAGPLLQAGERLLFPAPADLIVQPADGLRGRALRPIPLGPHEHCDFLPERGLSPVRPPTDLPDFKPEPGPALWSDDRMAAWLLDERGDSNTWNFSARADADSRSGDTPIANAFLKAPVVDRRMHVQIDPASGASKEEMLFVTSGLDLSALLPFGEDSKGALHVTPPTIASRVRIDDEAMADVLRGLDVWTPIGGERRLAHWTARALDAADARWQAPAALVERLKGLGAPALVRMILATPAIFHDGWKPGWLQPTRKADGSAVLRGRIEGTRVDVRLVGAVLDRWRPISGWSYESAPPGPKRVRRLVPAGSTYFFVVESGSTEELAGAWLQPVSDEPQDRCDGFGLAIWGPWAPFDSSHVFGD